MKKSILMGAAVGTATVLSAGAIAGYMAWKNPAFAEVVSVEPVKQAVTTPDKVCRDAHVTRRKPATDENRIVGTVVGGMAGGVVGEQIGNGAGKKHCKSANRVSQKVVAYDVRYRLHGKTSKVRMDHDPGERLPVRGGKVVVTPDAAARPEPRA